LPAGLLIGLTAGGGKLVMTETTETQDPINSAAHAVCDALRYLGDASYAVLPSDMAHSLGDFKKSFLRNVRELIDKDIEWIDARVAGGDRLREEWKRACTEEKPAGAAGPVN
jgi:hypothetical protein